MDELIKKLNSLPKAVRQIGCSLINSAKEVVRATKDFEDQMRQIDKLMEGTTWKNTQSRYHISTKNPNLSDDMRAALATISQSALTALRSTGINSKQITNGDVRLPKFIMEESMAKVTLIKNSKQLVDEIAKREGKKVPTPIGNIREIVAIISDIHWEQEKLLEPVNPMFKLLNTNGKRRAKARAKKNEKK